MSRPMVGSGSGGGGSFELDGYEADGLRQALNPTDPISNGHLLPSKFQLTGVLFSACDVMAR